MSFLTPLFLLGGLAVALPIIFHLIRRTTRERIPFSSLMFLLPTPPRVTRRSRLEHIFLLVLRCLVLALLALGFARPFFNTKMPAPPVTPEGRHVLVLLDTSASMQRADLWAQAVQHALQTAESVTGASDQLAVARFDRAFEPVVTFEQWAAAPLSQRVALVRNALAQLKPGWGGTDLAAGMIQAAEVLEEVAGRAQSDALRKQIVLITDLGEGSRVSGLQGYEWPESLDVTPLVVRVDRPTNAGLQPLVADLESEQAQRVRISNAGDSEREQFRLSWVSGETAVGSVIEVYVPPGRSRVVQAPTRPAGGTALKLTGDDHSFDNTAYVAPATAVTVPVLYLGRDAETDASASLYYLKRAFQHVGQRDVQLIAGPPDQVLSSPELSRATLVVVTDIPGPASLERLQRCLDEGKTILWVMESAAAAPALATLLEGGPLTAEEATVADYAMLGRIDFQHPLFAVFADPRYSDFTKIHVWKYRRLDFSSLPDAREVVRFDVGDPAWTAVRIRNGTVHILTTSWRPADSQLGLSSKFVPLLYVLLEQSGAPGLQPTSIVAGDPITLERPEESGPLTMQLPDGSRQTLQSQFLATDLPGLYQAFAGGRTQLFAVNLSPEESRTAPLELERLEQLGVPLEAVVAENVKRAAEQRAVLESSELENRQKLWRWLLAAAIVILILESWIAGRLSRATSAPEPSPAG